MMSDIPSEGEPVKTDPGDLARVLELELLQKRAQWQHGLARRRVARVMSFVFLFIVVGVAILALSYLFTRVNGGLAHRPLPSPAASPGR